MVCCVAEWRMYSYSAEVVERMEMPEIRVFSASGSASPASLDVGAPTQPQVRRSAAASYSGSEGGAGPAIRSSVASKYSKGSTSLHHWQSPQLLCDTDDYMKRDSKARISISHLDHDILNCLFWHCCGVDDVQIFAFWLRSLVRKTTVSVLYDAQLLPNKQQQIWVAFISTDISRAVPIQ